MSTGKIQRTRFARDGILPAAISTASTAHDAASRPSRAGPALKGSTLNAAETRFVIVHDETPVARLDLV